MKEDFKNVNDHLSHQSDIFANLVGGVRFATNPNIIDRVISVVCGPIGVQNVLL